VLKIVSRVKGKGAVGRSEQPYGTERRDITVCLIPLLPWGQIGGGGDENWLDRREDNKIFRVADRV